MTAGKFEKLGITKEPSGTAHSRPGQPLVLRFCLRQRLARAEQKQEKLERRLITEHEKLERWRQSVTELTAAMIVATSSSTLASVTMLRDIFAAHASHEERLMRD